MLDNAVSSDADLFFTFNNVTVGHVGTLSASGAVIVRIEVSVMTSLPARNLSEWRTQLAQRCDVTRLTVERDVPYTSLSALTFLDTRGPYELRAQTDVRQPDGTTFTDRRLFFFTQAVGAMRGEVTCAATGEAYTFDVRLQPGWNIVHETGTYDPVIQRYRAVRYEAQVGSTYNGRWVIHDATF